MHIETVLALLGFALVANLALILASPGPLGDRLRRRQPTAAAGATSPPVPGSTAGAEADRPSPDPADAPSAPHDARVDPDADVAGHAVLSPAVVPASGTAAAPTGRQATPAAATPGPRATRSGRGHLSADPGDPDIDADLRPAAFERVIRVATWVFLFAATTIVLVTDLWTDRKVQILVVLAATALASLVLRRLIRGWVPEVAMLAIEGAVGLVFAGMLIALTGGALSPFSFLVPLIVVGAALVVTPGVALLLTAGAGAVYLAAIAIAAAGTPGEPSALAVATAGINLAALCLVAYVGMAIGREQRRAREDAHRLATEDPLTGLRTRPSLFGSLERELARSSRTGRSFCLLMIDLDDLKRINDGLGHLYGDRALRLVGDVIRTGIRQIDTGARFGGDEFVVLLPETDPTGGWVLAEKIRRGVAEGGLTAGDVPIRTSVSVGLVTYPDDGETVDALLERADAAMYGSKRAGRDRVTGVPVMDPDPIAAGRRGHPV